MNNMKHITSLLSVLLMATTAAAESIGRCPCVLDFAIPCGVAGRIDVRALQNTDGPFGGPSTQRLTMSSRHHAEHVCTIVLGELKSGICFHPNCVGLLRVCCGPKPNCCQFSPRFTG